MTQEPMARNSPLRILEIGGNMLFLRAVPRQTEFYRSATKPRGLAHRAFGPLRMFRCLRDLRRGKFDLVVVHANQYAPWHPRSFLTALRDWHVRAPVGLFGLFAWRFVHLFHEVPIAAIDLGDGFGIGRHNFFLIAAGSAFFKRELPADNWQVLLQVRRARLSGGRRAGAARLEAAGLVEKLKPISYGTKDLGDPRRTVPAEKTVDIFFAGAIESNSTARACGIAELRALEREGYVVDIPAARLPPREFLQRMAAAWLAWSPQGLGYQECARHYEAPLVNTVPMMNYPTITRDRPAIARRRALRALPGRTGRPCGGRARCACRQAAPRAHGRCRRRTCAPLSLRPCARRTRGRRGAGPALGRQPGRGGRGVVGVNGRRRRRFAAVSARRGAGLHKRRPGTGCRSRTAPHRTAPRQPHWRAARR